MPMSPLVPNAAPFEPSPHYPASQLIFVRIPPGVREAGFHIPPRRPLAIWLGGEVEFQMSDSEVKQVSGGNAVLVEDTHGIPYGH